MWQINVNYQYDQCDQYQLWEPMAQLVGQRTREQEVWCSIPDTSNEPWASFISDTTASVMSRIDCVHVISNEKNY